jgi:glutathione S-transferase
MKTDHLYSYAFSEYAKNRYLNETKRLYSVLDTQLGKQAYLVGDSYGIADIKAYGWVKFAHFLDIDLSKEFPNLKVWFDKIDARPAVKKGLDVPPKN